MSSTQQQESLSDVRNKVVQVIDQQTIRRVRQECQRLVKANEIPVFESFLDNEPDFILTGRREEILNNIHNRLRDKDSPGVFLHGAYGSGKTVLMKCIADLCEKPTEIGGVEFPQFTYGETPIDCFQISLQDNNTPNELLLEIYKSVLESDNLTEADLLERFEEEKSTLSLDGYDNLPPKLTKELKQLFDDPDSIDDIARACKSLSSSNAHHTVTWFSEEYYEAEGNYPGFYIDEFEQAFRGIDPNEKNDLKAIIRKIMRCTVDSHAELATPPYILFINSVGLEELEESIQAHEDTIDRIRGSVNYSINLTQEETVHLFSELYHLYTHPLTTDYQDKAPEWHEKLNNAEPGEDDYVYPFTYDALNSVLSIIDSKETGDRDDRVVLSFRAYKTVLMAFLREWDGTGRIDREYLYKHGDSVRQRLGKIKRADLNQLPGEQTIKEQIEEDYPDSISIQRVLTAVAREAVLNREDHPALFSPAEVEELAGNAEVDLTTSITELIRQAAIQCDYIDRDGDHLVIHQERLAGIATTEPIKSTSKVVDETIQEFEADTKSTLDLWKEALENQLQGGSGIDVRSSYLEIDVLGDVQYTETVYLSIGTSGPPDEWESIEESRALKFGIHLGPSDDDNRPAEFTVQEISGKAPNISSEIQADLNGKIDDNINEENRPSTLLSYIEEIHHDKDSFEQYRIFLNLSLLDILEEGLPEDVRVLTSPRRSFAVVRYVKNNLKGQYKTGEYVPELLGLSSGHKGGDVLDFVYAIKNFRETGDLIYRGTDFDISREMHSIPNLSRGKKTGDEVRQLLSGFENEQFLKKDSGSYDVTDDFSEGTQKVVNLIDDALQTADDDELSFEEVVELVFGTKKVAPVAQAYLYLILSIVSLHDTLFVLSGDNDSKIVRPGTVLSAVRESVKNSHHDAIKREALLQARLESEDLGKLKSLKNQYGDLDTNDDIGQLEELGEGLETDYTTDSDTLRQDIRSVRSYEVYVETVVSEYIGAVESINELEAGLPFLIHDALSHLVTQLKEAKDVLERKQSVISGKETMDTLLNSDFNIDSDGIQISCIDTIGDHLDSHDVAKAIEDADIDTTIQRFLDDEIDATMVYEDLSRTRRQIVPKVNQYNPTEHEESLEDDSEALGAKFEAALVTEEEQIEAAREQLQAYEPRVPEGEKSLVTRGERFLEQCAGMLDDSLEEFDAEQYNNLWEKWLETEQELAEEAFDDSDIEKLIEDLDGSVSAEKVTAAGTDLNDAIKEMPDKSEMRELIKALDIDSEVAIKMQAVLIKRWAQTEESP